MLSKQEMTEAKDKLKAAKTHLEDVRSLYIHGGYLAGARLVNDAVNLLDDEIAALSKSIGSQP